MIARLSSPPSARRCPPPVRHITARARRGLRPNFDRLDDRLLLTAGSLDPSFGTAGHVGIPINDYGFDYSPTYPRSSVAVQEDGKILIATSTGLSQHVTPGVRSYYRGSDFRISRYLPDGTPDASFGTGGTVTTSFGDLLGQPASNLSDGDDIVSSILVLPDGKILVAGTSFSIEDDRDYGRWSAEDEFGAVARFDSEGDLDPSFGEGGRVIVGAAWGSTPEVAGRVTSLAAQPDGKVVLATGAGGIVRLNDDGTRDAAFGDFDAETDARTGSIQPRDGELPYQRIATRADGSILVAGAFWEEGESIPEGYREGFLVRSFDAAGSPDTAFGVDGLVTTTFSLGGESRLSQVEHLVLRPDGGLLVGGYSGSLDGQTYRLALAAYRADGGPDGDFGDGGKVLETPGGLEAEWVEGLAALPDGKFLLLDQDYRLHRYSATGQADASFPAVDTELALGDVVVQPDGKILVAGIYGWPVVVQVRRYLGDGPAATATTTTLISSSATSVAGQVVTFTAEVGAVGGAVPIGAVTFRDGGLDLGTATLDTSGIARFSTAALAPGSHAITAHYAPAPGAAFAVSISSASTQTVADVTATNLQAAIESLAPGSSQELTIQATDAQVGAIVAALGGLQTPEAPLVVTVSLADSTPLPSQDVSLPAGATLIIDAIAAEPIALDHWTVQAGVVEIRGNVEPIGLTVLGGTVILNGVVLQPGSPALTVTSGDVVLVDATALGGGDSPTILVNGGRLTIRGSTIHESADSDQAAILIVSGEVDLGSASDEGGNTVNVRGAGALIVNATDARVSAVGTAFTFDGLSIATSSLSGLVFEDFNADGEVDFGERGIAGVSITLTGSDFLGPVHRELQTDADGAYVFLNLLPGSYCVVESQPEGYTQGINTVGTIDGVVSGEISRLDRFDNVPLAAGLRALNYNFGERPAAGGAVAQGQTAGIGFWNNRHGQDLIRNLNGGPTSTRLGAWLAATLPNMFGVNAGAGNLAAKDNASIAEFFQSRFVLKGEKLDAQVLATALAVYVTNENLSALDTPPGSAPIAARYGFVVSGLGVGTATFGVGANGEAFDVADGTVMTVMDLLLAVDEQADDGLLYSGNVVKRRKANNVFAAINQAGGA